MSFNSNIPQPTDLISVSQQDLLNNFTSMQSTYTTDHYGLNPVTNLGFHKHVTFPNDPTNIPAPAAGFCASYGVTTLSQTYPAFQRDGTGTVYQGLPIKAYALFTAANPPVSSFTLPYANIASVTRISQSIYQVTFVDAFPNSTYGGLATFSNFLTNRQITVGNQTPTTCQVRVLNPDGTLPPDVGNLIMVAFLN